MYVTMKGVREAIERQRKVYKTDEYSQTNWLVLLATLVGVVADNVLTGDDDGYVHALEEVAAVCLQMIGQVTEDEIF